MIWDPFEEIRRFEKEMNNAFSNYYAGNQGKPSRRMPAADMEERENDVVAVFELPGSKKEDINLKVDEETIEVSVETKKKTKTEKSYSDFYRKTTLPCKIIPEKTKANYHAGVLEVVMPKAEKKKSRKQVKIKID